MTHQSPARFVSSLLAKRVARATMAFRTGPGHYPFIRASAANPHPRSRRFRRQRLLPSIARRCKLESAGRPSIRCPSVDAAISQGGGRRAPAASG